MRLERGGQLTSDLLDGLEILHAHLLTLHGQPAHIVELSPCRVCSVNQIVKLQVVRRLSVKHGLENGQDPQTLQGDGQERGLRGGRIRL